MASGARLRPLLKNEDFPRSTTRKKLGIEAPMETGDLPAMLKTLEEKQEWLKTAPCAAAAPRWAPHAPYVRSAPPTSAPAFLFHRRPKPKKEKKKEEKKEEKEEKKEGDAADADAEEWKKKEAEELKAKQAAEAKKAAEKQKAEDEAAAKAAALEAAGKKVAGGLHKFDASEVDVNGGNATADDFMDAFGFGGDDDEAR